jgi:hypothetical protein
VQYMLLIYDDEKVIQGLSEEERNEFMGAYWAYTDEVKASGAYVAADALQSVGTATTVRFRDGEQLLTDGPFAETKEILGGYYIIDVEDLDTALGWAGKMPNIEYGTVEVRPVMSFD